MPALGTNAVRGYGARPQGSTPTPRLVNSIFQLSINFQHPVTGPWMNVMHFQPETEPGQPIADVLADLATGFENNVETELLAMLAGDCKLMSYSARRLTGGSPTYTLYVGAAGSAPSPVDTTALAMNINWIPAEAPWNYGHFYMSGISDTWFSGNTFLVQVNVPGDNLASKLFSDFTGGVPAIANTWTPVIYDRGEDRGRIIGAWLRDARPTVMSRRMRPWNG